MRVQRLTAKVMEQIRDDIIPKSVSLAEARLKVNEKFGTQFNERGFRNACIEWLGAEPGKFRKREVVRQKVPEGDSHDSRCVNALVSFIKGKKRTLKEVCNRLKVWPEEAIRVIDEAKGRGFEIAIGDDGVSVESTGLLPRETPVSITFPKATHAFCFAAISDTHYGSKYCRAAEIRDFVEYAYGVGVRDVLHAGDLLDGHGVYRGHELEVEAVGFEAQAQICIDSLPKMPGLRYHVITGNYDTSFHKLSGVNPGKALVNMAAQCGRSDLVHLGVDRALVYYGGALEGEGVAIELWHPDGGGAYAMTYKAQRYIANMQSGTKPQILIVGHLHYSVQFEYRNIFAVHPGCFEAQTPYMARKGLVPAMGGYIFSVQATDDWSVRSLKTEWCPYYGSFSGRGGR